MSLRSISKLVLQEALTYWKRLDELESKYDKQFDVVFDAIRQLMAPPPVPTKGKIGFPADSL